MIRPDGAAYSTGRAYSYAPAGSLTTYEETPQTVGGLKPHLALPSGTYTADGNGNLKQRQGDMLLWNGTNQLWIYNRTTPALLEEYYYADDGRRVRKISNGVTTYYPSPLYEQTGSHITKYYYFNGQRIAMRQDGVLAYLHTDHLGGTALVTDQSKIVVAQQGYWAYGRPRSGGPLPTDHHFTGQKLDSTGLLYYSATLILIAAPFPSTQPC